MGFKSTIDITRSEAIRVIKESLDNTPYNHISNEELEDMMYELGIGDDTNKPYYGHNFNIKDEING